MSIAPTLDPATSEDRVPVLTVIVYGLPQLGVGATFFLIGMYFMKYSTDVLLIGPGVMGTIFGLSRIWDAISDPVAGFLSDRSRARMGRRRAWMLASVLPLVVFTVMLWSPPQDLGATALKVWVALSLFACYTAVTMFGIPHEALGAELSQSYHARTPIFAVRHIVGMGGFLLGVGALYLMEVSQDKRATAFLIAVGGMTGSAALILFAVAWLRERPEYQGRGAQNLQHSMRDVYRNPHAKLLLAVFFIENLGSAVLMVLLPYFTHYIMDAEGMTAPILLAYALPNVLFTPAWVWLARRFGKKPLWVFSMAMLTCAFGGIFFVQEGDLVLLFALSLLAGLGGGCGAVVGPSIQADVIDWDELHTGERKEGAYFAGWNLARKLAGGAAIAITGLFLQFSGYEANAVQSEETQLVIRLLFSAFPFACHVVAIALLLRFDLDEHEHTRIRGILDTRRQQSA